MLFLHDRLPINNCVLILSVMITIGFPALGRFNIVAILVCHCASRAGLSSAHHYAAVDDGAMMDCFLAYQCIGAPPKNQTAPSVDFASFQSPCDASAYATSCLKGMEWNEGM